MNHFLGESKEMPPAECPNCGYVSDMAAAIDENVKPSPNDISICINCGHLSAFTEDLKLRNLTDDEIKKVAGDQRVVKAMTALDHVKRQKASEKKLDQNIIYPGKDPDFTFPEETE